jgi:hypothetical protein
MSDTNKDVINKIAELYRILFEHDGYGEMTVAMRILKRNQKEIIIKCGCEHRYVVDWKPPKGDGKNLKKSAKNVGSGPNAPKMEKCAECAGEEPGGR